MAKKKAVKEKTPKDYGLTKEQFDEWELMECNLDIYKKFKKIK